MTRAKIFSFRILKSRRSLPSNVDEAVVRYSARYNIDPNLFRALFLIENYSRPRWFQLIEWLAFKIGILEDPSLGPFQIKVSNVGHFSCEADLVNESLDYISKLIIKNNLSTRPSLVGFRNFGLEYNNTEEYGKVFSRVYDRLTKGENV